MQVEQEVLDLHTGRPLSTCIPDGYLQVVIIPDAVFVQFYLLMISTTLLETSRGL